MPRQLFRAGPAEGAIIALVDIERMVSRLSRLERRSLRDNTVGSSAACFKLEGMLREGGYLA